MIRKLVLPAGCLMLLALLALGFSRASRAKDEWLPISPEDLALKDNPASPGAHAMILYREDYIDAEGAYETDYRRIKIFTAEGKEEWGDVEIEYLRGQSNIADIRARTIRPDGGVVNFDGKIYDKELVKASGIKEFAKTFSLPEVQPGSIIEYKYREQHDPNYYWSIAWSVQEALFTRLARFSIKPPSSPSAPALYWRKHMIPGDAKPEKQKDGTLAMEIRDFPGLEDEGLMPPAESVRARISFFYRSNDTPFNQTADQLWKRTAKKWDDDEEHFVDKKGALQSVVSETVAANDTPEVKLQKLYARAQQIHNLQFDQVKTEKEEKREKLKENNNVEDLLKHGYGIGRQINYLMVGLARAAGFESALVYVGPRSSSPFFPKLEDPSQLSADIVWVRVSNKDVYLDPASKYYPYGLLPWYETGVSALKPTKQGPEFIEVPLGHPADAVLERHADVAVDSSGTVAGKLQLDYIGISGAAEREFERNDDEAGRKKHFTDEIKSWLPGGTEFEVTEISGWDDIYKPVRVEGKMRIPGFASEAGRRALLPVTFFAATEPGYFTHEKRVNPIFFKNPYINKDSISIGFANGFKIESVPPEVKVSPGAGISYDIKSTQTSTGVTIERQIVIDGMMYSVGDYPAFRRFFNAVKTGDEGQIIFQPVQTSELR